MTLDCLGTIFNQISILLKRRICHCILAHRNKYGELGWDWDEADTDDRHSSTSSHWRNCLAQCLLLVSQYKCGSVAFIGPDDNVYAMWGLCGRSSRVTFKRFEFNRRRQFIFPEPSTMFRRRSTCSWLQAMHSLYPVPQSMAFLVGPNYTDCLNLLFIEVYAKGPSFGLWNHHIYISH